MAKSKAKKMLDEMLENDAELKQFIDVYNERLDAALALVQLREEEGLSQRALAEKAGKTQATIARIENGNMNPTFKMMNEIAAGVGKKVKIEFVKA
ncbi:MAG: helix-turn-helix domain-containing protein [Streptococcaceae bacterium]|jgi:predicted transcriptional regulator|nr:helix-turn-helix domain-containing protein [Streptococcaceae bacterium]